MDPAEAIIDAIKAGDIDRVKELLASDPRLASARNAQRETPILQAVYRMRTDLVELLLAARPETDIYEAVAVGQLRRVKELARQDPSLVNSYAPDGFTALGLASFFGHPDVVEFLLAAGAEVNAASKNEMSVTPLHAAAAGRHEAIVVLLLKSGADPNARQNSGYTPLHSAAAAGQEGITRLLLAHGAEVTAKSDEGMTPLQLALERKHAGVADLLRQHGAV